MGKRTTIIREKAKKQKQVEKLRKKRYGDKVQNKLVAEGMAILFPLSLS